MAILSRQSGGGLGAQHLPSWLTWLPEMFFALVFGAVWFPLIGWWALVVMAWAYIWMQTGHGNALAWGGKHYNPDHTNTLSPFVKKLADWFGFEYSSTNYARLFMAVKGFLITLPIGCLGVLLWPLGYEIGNRAGDTAISEAVAGAGIGINLVLFIEFAPKIIEFIF